MKSVSLLLALITVISSVAQDSAQQSPSLTWKGFIDVYYSYDFNQPLTNQKPSFLYNHTRHNEVTINLALISVSYNEALYRATFALMAGTYPQYNLATEPGLLRPVYEANIGVKLSPKKELWLDAGILPSHIGFESAISKDNPTLTRSIAAENSPYYEAGARLSYQTNNKKWYMAGLLLNGWQRIKRVDGNSTPAFGTHFTFKPSDKLKVNSSTFIGNDKPDTGRRWRYFHDFFAVWQVAKNWNVIVGFDIGGEQTAKGESHLAYWYTPVCIVRYHSNRWAIGGRTEYYSDKKGVIVPPSNAWPFQLKGYSINIDRQFGKSILWRLEGRGVKNRTPYFTRASAEVSSNAFITTSLSLSVH